MSGYIGPQPVPQATQHRQSFVATANQTAFATVGYTPQFLDLYLNGVKLAGEDYTATNGSDVVLATGAAVGDILEYVAYTPFEVANQTFTGTTTLTGNLLVGTTSTGFSAEGHVFRAGDYVSHTVDNDVVALFNRTTSDGQLLQFRKDGTAIGSLQSRAGVVSSIVLDPRTTTGAGAGLTGTAQNAIVACDATGATIDATNDLGVSAIRWKDLYLSGGVYLGGAGAANYMSDYEEGTWTPILRSDGGNDYANTARGGLYVKSGNQVTISFYFKRTAATVVGANMLLYGIPFTPLQISASYPQPFGHYAVGTGGDGILRNGPSGFGARTGAGLIYFNNFGGSGNSNLLWNPAGSTAADIISFQASYITS
jgi:hypothetical protein